MDLTVKDRILLFSLLPREGDVLTLKALRKLREEISFSDDELKDFEIVSNENSVNWNQEKCATYTKPVDVTPTMHVLIACLLKELSTAKKLVEMQVELYDKFVTD